MKEFKAGDFVKAKAGRDKGKIYVIIRLDEEYLYLVDGKYKTIDNPKKKKIKHTCYIEDTSLDLSQKIQNNNVRNEDIKREIKMLQNNMLARR